MVIFHFRFHLFCFNFLSKLKVNVFFILLTVFFFFFFFFFFIHYVATFYFLGMNATVLNGAVVGRGSLIAAGTVVLEGERIPPGSLVAGVPGKVRRELSVDEQHAVSRNAQNYIELSREHRAMFS